MEALPAGAPPAPKNQTLVGATLASVAILMLTGGMLGVWAVQRRQAIDLGQSWLPSDVTIPEVPTNVMLIAFIGVVSFAHWASWAARRDDKANTVFALGATAFVALLIINAQAFVYTQMELPISQGPYGAMFFAITGTFIAVMIGGTIFSLVAGFRVAGGRSDRHILAAHTLVWYAIGVAYCGIWFLVYVTK